ncbi:hypothetical protein DVR12_02930 [Chitinophaga silvatica]|uniref:Uncharacterized protein n=1 Tax=Chitinophaga silvatica TaxID=2282649 RepID=A0A3E1YH52_9BACT|nr:hypothetical protein DVR12_02930 [Chitinophaga silvatica]
MCLQVKKKKILEITDHRRTYNLVLKEMYSVCSWCPWHPTFWHNCSDSPISCMIYCGDKDQPIRFKNPPSWKVVSKNRKQWMKKRFFTENTIMNNGEIYIKRWW